MMSPEFGKAGAVAEVVVAIGREHANAGCRPILADLGHLAGQQIVGVRELSAFSKLSPEFRRHRNSVCQRDRIVNNLKNIATTNNASKSE